LSSRPISDPKKDLEGTYEENERLKIKILLLANCGIDDSTIADVVEFIVTLWHCELVDLSGNNIGEKYHHYSEDEGKPKVLQNIKKLFDKPQIKSICLDGTPIFEYLKDKRNHEPGIQMEKLAVWLLFNVDHPFAEDIKKSDLN
jgi:hypothetical protein